MAVLIWQLDGKDREDRQLYSGSVVLTAIALVFLLGTAMYYFADSTEMAVRAKEIFATCAQLIPPLLTLVIGFYLGKRSEATEAPIRKKSEK